MKAEMVVKIHKGRGCMENYIKESKRSFLLDKANNILFSINEVRMTVPLFSGSIIFGAYLW